MWLDKDMNNTATITRNQRRAFDNMVAAERTAEGYFRLLGVAQSFKMEYEIERLTQALAEAEADRDDMTDQMIESGLTPEQVEAL